MKVFNTAGPCRSEMHYMLPPLRRIPEAPELIEKMGYFVLHAPRQTGKTTVLRALAEELTASGRYAALHFSCEAGEVAGDDFEGAQRTVLAELRLRAETSLPPELRPPPFPEVAPDGFLVRGALAAWAEACPRPLVLFFDEIDALRGQSLLSMLRQLRAGYPERPHAFPASVVLCGLRDVREYKVASGGDPNRLGTSSPFNVKVASLRLGNFSAEEVAELYRQHTAETGQMFTDEAVAHAFEVTGGQPWLVNAVAREIVEVMRVPVAEAITAAHVDVAKERLILARQTHLDSLVARLMEPRVRRVIEPMLVDAPGDEGADLTYDDDVSYVRDLGLVLTRPLRIANPIYKEVIVRVLGNKAEDQVVEEPRAFVLPDGRLAWRKLLRAFSRFWREHGQALATRMPYPEAGPQLVLMAFLQRLVNGGGYIDREYGVGRGRIDLLVRYPYEKIDGTRAEQRRAMEIKVWRRGQKNPLKKGLAQLDEYLERLGLSRGTLWIFDARGKLARKPVRKEDVITRGGRRVRVMWA
ncbi:AAA family ATPase [Polyangium sorediatum]|uniref:ATP-binding protein n=1 Tax=Polyangium sorediatum TaxID=889274 RepID=A0ABT6NUE6_9BACT|nr:ATP-binding protein [Polyangium sorediatum]MDI1431967.1 ATP-binding protein [Polyangium sorediatum]